MPAELDISLPATGPVTGLRQAQRRPLRLSLFNAHHNSRCFMPIHIYEAMTGKPVTISSRLFA
jgi:hypothetical protein